MRFKKILSKEFSNESHKKSKHQDGVYAMISAKERVRVPPESLCRCGCDGFFQPRSVLYGNHLRYVDRFKALLFDMNGTFMFDHDRLGAEEDFFSTYKRLGGAVLTETSVHAAVVETCTQLRRDYDDPAKLDSFPQLLDAVVSYAKLSGLDAHTVAAVIAEHEVGTVPEWAAKSLLVLSRTHPLALVSNVWAPAHHWTTEFSRSGVAGAFVVVKFLRTHQ